MAIIYLLMKFGTLFWVCWFIACYSSHVSTEIGNVRSNLIMGLLQSWSDPELVNDPELVKWLYKQFQIYILLTVKKSAPYQVLPDEIAVPLQLSRAKFKACSGSRLSNILGHCRMEREQ